MKNGTRVIYNDAPRKRIMEGRVYRSWSGGLCVIFFKINGTELPVDGGIAGFFSKRADRRFRLKGSKETTPLRRIRQ